MSDENQQEGGFVTPPDLNKQKIFVRHAENVLRSYRNYNPETALLHKLMNSRHDFIIFEFYAQNLIQDMVEIFQAGITQKKRENCVAFMSFIKMLYKMLTERQKAVFAKKFVDEWQRFDLDHSPYFELISTNYEGNLENAVNTLYNSDAPEKQVETVKDEIRWAMLLSPSKVVVRLLRASTYNPKVLPAALTLLRYVPDLFYGRLLRMWHSETEIDIKEPLLKLVMCRLFADSRSSITKNEDWEAVEGIALSLCENVDGEGKSLMDPQELLELVLTELYGKNRSPMKSVEILTRIAAKILMKQDNPKEHIFQFAGSKRDQPRTGLFLTPTIIDLILALITEYDGKSKEIVVNLKNMLKWIGERMWNSGSEFDQETREYILDKHLPWYIDYSLSRWYCAALGIELKRVPPEIFYAMSEDETEFEMRDDYPKDGSIHKNYLTALVELALFDVECALELLDAKRAIEFDEIDVIATLETAIRDSYRKKPGLSGVESWEIGVFLKETCARLHPQQPEVDLRSILALMPEVTPSETVQAVPLLSLVKSVAIPALDKPLPDLSGWPTEPIKMMTMGELRRVRRLDRQRERALQRKVDATYARESEALKQKWIAEGIINPSKPNLWAQRIARMPLERPEITGREVVEQIEPYVVDEHERNELARILRPTNERR